jgi:hypothetical protein
MRRYRLFITPPTLTPAPPLKKQASEGRGAQVNMNAVVLYTPEWVFGDVITGTPDCHQHVAPRHAVLSTMQSQFLKLLRILRTRVTVKLTEG